MSKPIDFEELVKIVAERGRFERSITAIAGAPGSGKSTIAKQLVSRLNHNQAGSAAVLPMDGFHYDDAVLEPRGLLTIKGSPETFDIGGLHSILFRLHQNREDEIAAPVFDRKIEIARAGARIIDSKVRYLFVEGNYLLLKDPPWNALHSLFDTTVMLYVSGAELRRRLEQRWSALGDGDRKFKLEGNDLPNGQKVATCSIQAEFLIEN